MAQIDRSQAIFGDLEAFAEGGAGGWRIKQVRVPAITALPEVRRLVESLQCSEADAVERTIEGAAQRLEPPHREAALAHLGFTEKARKLIAPTPRKELAAKALNVDPRTYSRTETQRDERSRSYAEQILWMVTDALLAGAPPEGRKRILYVEDDPVFVDIVRQALPDYIVEEADALGPALRMLETRAHEFSLVLVDANLTDLDDRAGYEVLEYLQERCPGLPRILVTASRLTGPVTSSFIQRYGLSELLLKDHQMVPGLRTSVSAALVDV